jgi:hypothetical protein
LAKIGTKRREWSRQEVRELKSHARKVSAQKIARALRRTEGAVRQKAFSMGLSLACRA